MLQADGGTRTAAITGAYVALADAVAWLGARGALARPEPLVNSISAVSVGVIDGEPRLDLMYEEDVRAETDMNVVVTGDGDVRRGAGHRRGRAVPPRRARRAARPGGGRLRVVDQVPARCARERVTLDRAAARVAQSEEARRDAADLRRRPSPTSTVLGLDDVAPYDEVPESGATFADNALIKAREGFAHTGLPTVADDSGLTVDALNGMPGVLSARWSGRHGDDAANLQLVLGQLADTPDERLGAAFVCAVALVSAAGEVVVDGRMAGRLIRTPRGENGFGYDPIFVPAGYEVTSAELPSDEKDAISHRGQALRALVPHVTSLLS